MSKLSRLHKICNCSNTRKDTSIANECNGARRRRACFAVFYHFTIFEKSNFCPNSILAKLYNFLGKTKLSTIKKGKSPTFSRVFHPNFFDDFSREIKVVNSLKSPKPQHFHEFFTQKIRQFSREIKVEFFGKK